MKNSGIEWIGEIPDDWKVEKLKYIVTSLSSGGTPDSTNELYYEDTGIPWVIIADMKSDIIYDTQKKISRAGLESKNLKIFPQGTLLYAMYASVGKVSELGIAAAINQAILALTINCDISNKQYLKYCLRAYEQFVFAESNGNTQFNLNAYKVANFSFLFPTLILQHKIANYLDKKCAAVDRLIENQRAQIEKLKEYKQSVITEAVTRGLDPSAPMKDSGVEWIGNISTNHFSCKLKFLLKEKMTYGANESGEKNPENKVRYIRITDITSDGKLKDGENNLYLSFEQAKPYLMHDNDVLFARSGGTVGKTFLYKSAYGKCAFAGYLIGYVTTNS